MTRKAISLLLAILCVCTLLIPASAVEPVDPAPAEETAAPSEQPASEESAAPAEPTDDAAEEPSAEPSEAPAEEPSAEPSESPETTPTEEPSPEPSESPEPSPSPKPSPWYQYAMEYAAETGLMKGNEKGDLMPKSMATRAEVAAILTRVFGLTTGKGITQFSDVNKSLWYYKPLSVAAEMRIISGDTSFRMRPTDVITRQEAFAIIARTFSVPKGKTSSLNVFSDASSVGSWARADLAGMVEAGILSGSKGKISPTTYITRAEIAMVLYQLGLVMFDDPADLPADGYAVYTGSDTLDITDFSGQLYLAGGAKSVKLTGDAPEAKVFVRMEPGAKVTLNGAVDEVHLCTRNAVLRGSGSANAVELAAVGTSNELQTASESVTYDAGLTGVTSQANDPAALTPENRTSTVTVRYSGMDATGAKDGTRSCTVRWWLDGARQADQTLDLKNPSAAVSLKVRETLWQRNMPSEHTVKVQLLYGTDVVTNTVKVPVKNYTNAEYQSIAQNASYPYRIEVVKNQCTVLVYGLDKSGSYSILHKVFVCSPGDPTPIGTFHTGTKQRWGLLMGGVWGQYCTQIYGGYLFHSVFYHTTDPSTLYSSAYNQLGTICSHGCVRITVAAAKWMYENCPSGTTVQIYNSSSLPVPKPTAQRIPTSGVYSGWDPTDPDSRNPWNH